MDRYSSLTPEASDGQRSNLIVEASFPENQIFRITCPTLCARHCQCETPDIFSPPLYSAKEIYSGVPDKLSGPDYFPLPSQTSPRRIPKTTPDLPIQTSSRTPSELFPRPELKTMVHLFNTCSEVYIICHETKFQGEGHRHLTRTKNIQCKPINYVPIWHCSPHHALPRQWTPLPSEITTITVYLNLKPSLRQPGLSQPMCYGRNAINYVQ